MKSQKEKYQLEIPKKKFQLVYEILKRWWYCKRFDLWAPESEDYKPKLEERNLILIESDTLRKGKIPKEGSEQEKRVVTEIEGFPGLFVDSKVVYRSDRVKSKT